MNSKGLYNRVSNMIGRLEKQDVCMHGFILSVGGVEKAVAYYAPFEEGKPHRMYSVSKTMTALAIGMLMEEGKLGLDDHICDFFQDYLPENPPEKLLRLTLRDMLRMATGYYRTTYREGIDEDWAKTFFTGQPTHEPGTVFYYDTGCSQVLAALVKRLSGVEVIDYLNEKLFPQLGATDEKYWLRDPSGCCQGGTGLCMSLRDMHKVARAVMEGGRGLIPEWFCSEMGKKHIETALQSNEEEQYGYGWQCWMTRAGWAMYGLGGQLAVICPEKDTLLCTIADTRLDPNGVQRIYDAFFEEVYPYIGVEDMDFARFELAVKPLDNKPEYALHAAGPYAFEEGNMLGFKSVELQDDTLLIENERGKHPLRFGLGENVQDVFPGWKREEAPTLCSGGWLDKGILRIRCFVIGNAPCGVDMVLCFKGDSLTVQARKSFDPVTNRFEGVATGYRN